MLDSREKEKMKTLSEALEHAGYTQISYQVVHTTSRITSVRGPESVKKQDSKDAVYIVEAALNGQKGRTYWSTLPDGDSLISMMRENIDALGKTEMGKSCEENVDNSGHEKEICGQRLEESFVWEDHETVLDILQAAKKKAYEFPQTDLVEHLGYEQHLEEIYVLGPGKNILMDATGYHSLRADMKAEKNEAGKNKAVSYARGCCYGKSLHDMSAEKLALTVAEEAGAGIGAKPIKSGKYPVILKNSVMAEILEAYIPAFYADRIKNDRSAIAGMEGKRVAAENVTLKEVPDLKKGRICRRIDDEGVPVKEKYLIKDGIFETKLVNRTMAEELKLEPTGNGFKESPKSDVGIGITNVILKPEHDRAKGEEWSILDLKKKMGHGILVTDVDGVFAGTNVMNGTFSLIVKGRKIKDGQDQEAFCQVTIAGNFFEMLQHIQEMADDYTSTYPDCASVTAPSVYVGELTVSGI